MLTCDDKEEKGLAEEMPWILPRSHFGWKKTTGKKWSVIV